jgi:trk system potassium uptake protein TrkA
MTGKKLKIVIAGAGRVGLRTAQLMGERGHDVTIVECDERRARRIEEVTHAVVVCGDATRPSILEQTNVAGADVVAALTGHNGTNVAICMESEAMVEGDLWTVARVDGSKDEYDRFVDEVVFPEAAGARLTADALAFGEIQTLAELSADIEILQITVAAEAPVAGRLL